MAARALPEAREDLRDAARYYRNVTPPAVGKHLARRLVAAFKSAVRLIETIPLARPEHPDIPGARFVMIDGFPYAVFYLVKNGDVIVVAVEYATRDYATRIAERLRDTE